MKVSTKSLSIKHSILLLTLLPSLFISALLTTYLVLSRQSDAQSELLLQVNSAINYLAKSSELPLFSGDVSTLARLSNATIFNSDMKSVTFYDSNGKLLLTFGEEFDKYEIQLSNSPYSEEKLSQWVFQTPVFNTELDVDDYNDNEDLEGAANKQTKYLGWVQIIADKTPLLEKKRTILLAGVSVGSILFGILAFIALKFSNSITSPLEKLTKTVRELESGNLNSRVVVNSKGELKELVDGVNQLADKVKISNEALKVKVKEATQKLTSTLSELEARNIQLEITGNELVDASKVKDEFLASVSHELRTPLTSIIGYTDLLKKTKLDSKQETQVDTISQASKILLHLIENILDFSKLESDSLELENIPFNINQLLSEIFSLHMPAATIKNISLELSVDTNVPAELVGDPLRIEQILNNLIQNAIKFTTQGSVIVSVSSLEGECGLLFKIKDSGIGMNKQSQTQLFQPFNQLDSSVSRRFGGTGLGLVICQKLVSQFGGKIEINSEKYKGTEVTFSIKNIRVNTSVDKTEISLVEKKQVSFNQKPLNEKLIIVAEDNNFVQKLLSGIFEHEGASVIAVDDGLLVLEEMHKQRPDLIVLDYQMPFLDGIKTCEKIRREYSVEDLPIILLTADVININKKGAKEKGFNEVLFKPILGDELVECAKQLTNCKNKHKNKVSKVLDSISDDLLIDELSRLKKLILANYKANNYANIKKYTHELCGIAGSSSKHKELWKIAKQLDVKMNAGEYNSIAQHLDHIKKIIASR